LQLRDAALRIVQRQDTMQPVNIPGLSLLTYRDGKFAIMYRTPFQQLPQKAEREIEQYADTPRGCTSSARAACRTVSISGAAVRFSTSNGPMTAPLSWSRTSREIGKAACWPWYTALTCGTCGRKCAAPG